LQTEHGIKCTCGQTYQNPEKLTRHVTTEKVLDEVKRIAGDRFHELIEGIERDARSGNIHELAESHGIEMKPENATDIAKKQIIHLVRRHDEELARIGEQ